MRRAMLMHFGWILLLTPSCKELPVNCADGQVAKWNDGTKKWECANDEPGDIIIAPGCVCERCDTTVGKNLSWRNHSGYDVTLLFGDRHPFGPGNCGMPCEIPVENNGWALKTAMSPGRYEYSVDGCSGRPKGPAWVIINQTLDP